ncbi:pseudouridine synthase [Trametes elegans]|nr:pseudouridine synthase [Trametes elegans]
MMASTAVRRAASQLKARGPLPPHKLVIYEDKAMFVINKPGNMSMEATPNEKHAGKGGDLDTALQELQETLSLPDRPRTVHRLDKHTTGSIVVARTLAASRELSKQIRDRNVDKWYLALVFGNQRRLSKPKGIMETELECRDGRVMLKDPVYPEFVPREPMTPLAKGDHWTKTGTTEYEVLAFSTKVPVSLLKLRLVTGYKHQIRVQLAQFLGTPVLNDTRFAPSTHYDEIRNRIAIPSFLYLHSSRVSLDRYRPEGPRKKFRLDVSAPVFRHFFDACKQAHIPLSQDDRFGGVWVDGHKVRGPGSTPEAQNAVGHMEDDEGVSSAPGDTIEQIGGVWYGPGATI